MYAPLYIYIFFFLHLSSVIFTFEREEQNFLLIYSYILMMNIMYGHGVNICRWWVKGMNIYRRLKSAHSVERKMKKKILLVSQVVGVSLFMVLLC